MSSRYSHRRRRFGVSALVLAVAGGALVLPQQAAASAGLDQPAAATSVSVLAALQSSLGSGATITVEQPTNSGSAQSRKASAAGCQVKINYNLNALTQNENRQDYVNRPIAKHRNNLNSLVSAKGGWKDGVWGGIHYEDSKNNVLVNYDIYEIPNCSQVFTAVPPNGLPLWAATLIATATALLAMVTVGIVLSFSPATELWAAGVSECVAGFLLPFLVAGLSRGAWAEGVGWAIFGCFVSVIGGALRGGAFLRDAKGFKWMADKVKAGVNWAWTWLSAPGATAATRGNGIAIELVTIAQRCGVQWPTCSA